MENSKALHRWMCRTCRKPILPGEDIAFADSALFRAYHPGECWEKRPRHFRSKTKAMMDVMRGARTRR